MSDNIDLAALLAEEDDFADDDLLDDYDPAPALIARGVMAEPEVEYDDEPETKPRQKGEPRRPMLSGHCLNPQTANPGESHARCARNGSGNRANPAKEFAPCPCGCHLGDEYECGNCGKEIRETEFWTGDGEVTYVHVDHSGRAIGEDC